ncbi:NAD(P)/FAD-dependent oxidoreductase [Dyadobacter tibetensis]|uniref:NAD(P)/FAD-dependent oxidoreductase n=1 Tax=Dyadobacter tibetensis TaxID=1211851 RepID=UPI0004AFCADF|nr:FAD/NAD(P)-binding oxidoreductase [Dyadobacter tibetensis]
MSAKLRVLVLGAGFGGLELSTILSEKLGDQLDLTLIDQSDSFFFGFSKFDVMFNRKSSEGVRIHYKNINKPGVRFICKTISRIDPILRRIHTSDESIYEADILVVALGADYDIGATPGLATGGNEFYSFEGALRLREALPHFSSGNVIIGVCSAPFKCPPAPSEAALLMHDYLVHRRIRQRCTISLVMPFGLPIPPSPDTSLALIDEFSRCNIRYIPKHVVKSIDPESSTAILDDGQQLPFDLFLGIPKHCAPNVVLESGMTVNGWIPVSKTNFMTQYPGVYAIGDVTSVGTPKAGVFAEGAAKVAAASIIAEFEQGQMPEPYQGNGICYIEFGEGRVGKVSVNFFSGPKPSGTYTPASTSIAADKDYFGSSRLKRWFGTSS